MFVLSSPAWADVKVHGSTTVAFALMKPHKAEIEQLVGVEITLLPSSTTRALFDDLVGAGEQRRRHGDAEGTGGLGMRLEYESAIG
jgi:hypothetical protein